MDHRRRVRARPRRAMPTRADRGGDRGPRRRRGRSRRRLTDSMRQNATRGDRHRRLRVGRSVRRHHEFDRRWTGWIAMSSGRSPTSVGRRSRRTCGPVQRAEARFGAGRACRSVRLRVGRHRGQFHLGPGRKAVRGPARQRVGRGQRNLQHDVPSLRGVGGCGPRGHRLGARHDRRMRALDADRIVRTG